MSAVSGALQVLGDRFRQLRGAPPTAGEQTGIRTALKNLVGEVLCEYEKRTDELEGALRPFVHPRATERIPAEGAATAEQDKIRIEVSMAEWWRACYALRTLDANYLRSLPPHARPDESFIQELEERP